LISRYAHFETPDISDLMNRLYTMVADIRPQTGPTLPILGTAITVKTYPGDNLMVHKALDVAKPGDVIVIDTGGARRTAVLGDLVATKARHRGIAGFVVDGHPGGLAEDVPQRHVHGGDGGHRDGSATLVGGTVEELPGVLDAAGVTADEELGDVVAEVGGDGQFAAVERGVADADEALVGLDAQRDEVPRGAGDVDLGLGDLHGGPSWWTVSR